MESEGFLGILAEFRRLGIEGAPGYAERDAVVLTHHSTAIEGSSLSPDDSAALLSEGITTGAWPLFHYEMVRDHHEALGFVLEQAGAGAPVTPGLIREICAAVLRTTGSVVNTAAGAFDSSKGEFRRYMVRAGRRLFMDPAKVPDAVDRFCDGFRRRSKQPLDTLETYSLAFDAHYGLVNIHPFADGNGRTSRLLMNFVLRRQGLPLAHLFVEDKRAYIAALEESHAAGDTGAFREFMLGRQSSHLAAEIARFTRRP